MDIFWSEKFYTIPHPTHVPQAPSFYSTKILRYAIHAQFNYRGRECYTSELICSQNSILRGLEARRARSLGLDEWLWGVMCRRASRAVLCADNQSVGKNDPLWKLKRGWYIRCGDIRKHRLLWSIQRESNPHYLLGRQRSLPLNDGCVVRAEGLEPPCDQLHFQDLIRVR